MVLTEPPASYTSVAVVVISPQRRVGLAEEEAWVASVGRSVERVALAVPYERTAVAARASVDGTSVVVYGAVLPWLAITNHAPELVRACRMARHAFSQDVRANPRATFYTRADPDDARALTLKFSTILKTAEHQILR